MDQGEFALCREARRDERQAAEFPFDEPVEHAQPFRTFGMAVAGVMFQVTVVFNERKGGHDLNVRQQGNFDKVVKSPCSHTGQDEGHTESRNHGGVIPSHNQ